MTRIPWGRIATGGIIVAIGLLLLLVTTDTLEVDSLWAVVAAAVVLLGLWSLVRGGFRNLVGPVMVIAIAGGFFLEWVNVLDDGTIGTWWPAFLILFGVLLVVDRLVGPPKPRATDGGIVVLGTADRQVRTDRFADTDVVAIFGDSYLDLREAAIAEAPATVDAVAVFGDVTVRVPSDWHVDVRVDTVFGDVLDRRRVGADGDGPDLVVTGVAIFGDVEVVD
ncbi:MAG: LiaF transmembrane domain-containing protein [Halobacteriales archaeon]